MPTQGQREMTMLSPLRRSSRSALPAQQANGVPPGSGIASSNRRSSPLLSSMAAKRSARLGVVVWDDLDAVEQACLPLRLASALSTTRAHPGPRSRCAGEMSR